MNITSQKYFWMSISKSQNI